MSDDELLEDVLTRLLSAHEAVGPHDASAFDPTLWNELDAAGFTRIGVAEAAGGSGGSLDQAYLVAAVLGAVHAPVPVIETIVAGWLCATAGLVLPAGPSTFGPVRPQDRVTIDNRDGDLVLDGVLERVPWGASADHLVLAATHPDGARVVVLDRDRVRARPGRNIAGEPRDAIDLGGVRVDARNVAVVRDGRTLDTVALGCLLRAAATAGAMRRVVALARDHVSERVQFGRPLVSNQLIRHFVAELVAETAAADAAARSAMAFTERGPDLLAVAAAKVRTARSAGAVATTAHQLVGAIGFTDEHPLHRFTTRLWAWRDEFGTAGWWEERLGTMVAAVGPDRLWETIVDRPVPGAR